MENIKIKKATVDELPDIVKLNSFVQEMHVEKHPDVFKPVSHDPDVSAFFKHIMNQDRALIIVSSRKILQRPFRTLKVLNITPVAKAHRLYTPHALRHFRGWTKR